MANLRTGSLFYIVKQGKNIFLYIKKVWQSTLFCPFWQEGVYFSQLHLILYLFAIVFGVHIIMNPT